MSNNEKKTIGFTVGTFDLFHIGHLNLFKQAKEHCDYLIVGVNTDEWVLKCKNRPTVISYDDRAAIIAGCRYVADAAIAWTCGEFRGYVYADITEEINKILAPRDAHHSGCNSIFQHEVPTDNPSHQFAHRGIRISVGTAAHWYH